MEKGCLPESQALTRTAKVPDKRSVPTFRPYPTAAGSVREAGASGRRMPRAEPARSRGGGRYSTRGKHLWTQTTRTCRPSPSPQLVQVTRVALDRARANLRMVASPRHRGAKSTGNRASCFAEAGLAPWAFLRWETATTTAHPTAEKATRTLRSAGRRQVSLGTNPTMPSDEPPVSSSGKRVAIASLAPPSCCFLSAS